MRCHNCLFQNMPDTVACARCGAPLILDVTNDESSYLPPRAGMLKGLRPLRYACNRVVDRIPKRIGERVAKLFLPDNVVPAKHLAATLLSAVPGLGQVFLGRWKAAAIFFFGWLWWIFVAVQVPVEWWGGFFFGLVVIWHGIAALEALGVREVVRGVWPRIRAMIIILLVCLGPYLVLRQRISEHWGFFRALFPVPTQHVQPLDVLLVDRGRIRKLEVGDVVLVKAYSNMVDVGEFIQLMRPRTLAWIAAAGPATLTLGKDGVRVDGEPLHEDLFPPELNNIMPLEDVTFRLSEQQYLIMFPLLFRRQDIRDADARTAIWRRLWQELFVCERHDFEAQAVLSGRRCAIVVFSTSRRHEWRALHQSGI
jgi:hypothetical protein